MIAAILIIVFLRSQDPIAAWYAFIVQMALALVLLGAGLRLLKKSSGHRSRSTKEGTSRT